MIRLTLVIVAGVTAASASAQDKSATAPTAPLPEKKICRSITPTGSIMAKRFCLTNAEWKQLNGKTQADSDAFFAKRGANNGYPRDPADF